MSSSAGSMLILGVEVRVKATPTQQAVTRYDPLTGEGNQVVVTVLTIRVSTGGPFVPLPDSATNYEETKGRYDRLEGWINQQVQWRIGAWFKERGFKSAAEDIIKPGDLGAFQECGRYFLGRLLAEGSQSGYPGDEFAAAVPVPAGDTIVQVRNFIGGCFKDGIGIDPQLLLITTFG
jgi:hypothetical protein